MSTLPRMVEGDDAFAARLLRAGKAEAAPDRAKARVLAAAAVAIATPSSLAGASALAVKLGTLEAAGTTGWLASIHAAALWAVLGAGGIGVAVAVATVSLPATSPRLSGGTRTPTRAGTVLVAPRAVEATLTPPPAGQTQPSPTLPASHPTTNPATPPTTESAAAAAPRPGGLGVSPKGPGSVGGRTHTPGAAAKPADRAPPAEDELVGMRRAKLALKAGDAAAALAALAQHEKTFPRGAYAEEAAVLRVEALLAAGERATAEREASAFSARFPESPYAQRVRGLVGGAGRDGLPTARP
jgi:Outer membrane lipoprotein